MTSTDQAKLTEVKRRTWFYQFRLPDGTLTRTDLPESVLKIHTSRATHLHRIIERKVANPATQTALDFASHEGFFSIEMARHFSSVRGLEIRPESLAAARFITDVLQVPNVEYIQANLQEIVFAPSLQADFVLVYGLVYHMEDPIHVLRLASQLSREHILVETQIFPYDLSGLMEDGCYSHQRSVEGVFGLVPDYPHGREGGSTELALVPSRNALLFVLRQFGFEEMEVIAPDPDDYEQFRRGSRIIVYGRKKARS